ncbi:YibE/F family protein [Fusobacterium sp.]|uniref:YibE/F family protein n=1 Tax=Fusobacterium sp. TaxID=68766 RepID=UPI0025BE02A3|nr:YibE/F family protein [Fusobacterium sp.]
MKKIGVILIVFLFIFLGFNEELRDHISGKIFKKEQIGRVLLIDNSNMIVQGISRIGSQRLEVEILNGDFKGKVLEIDNLLNGSMEYDEVYSKGDKVLVAIWENDGETKGKVLSLLRMDKVIELGCIFIVLLLIYARMIGLKSLISFIGSVVIIWKYLIPALKSGENIFFITIITLVFLSALIIFLVAGFTRKGFTAFLGTMFGLFTTASLTFLFGDIFRIDGMNQPFAQSVVFASAMRIDILKIFYSAIVIGASGAAMDIAMDMAATIEELKYHTPEISTNQLIKSGFNVGRSVIGTMTTTLLLAYSGGFLTLMMLFLERDMTLLQILNMKLITSEIIKIIIGSIGLVVVAPMTTYIGGIIYSLEIDMRCIFKREGLFKKIISIILK